MSEKLKPGVLKCAACGHGYVISYTGEPPPRTLKCGHCDASDWVQRDADDSEWGDYVHRVVPPVDYRGIAIDESEDPDGKTRLTVRLLW